MMSTLEVPGSWFSNMCPEIFMLWQVVEPIKVNIRKTCFWAGQNHDCITSTKFPNKRIMETLPRLVFWKRSCSARCFPNFLYTRSHPPDGLTMSSLSNLWNHFVSLLFIPKSMFFCKLNWAVLWRGKSLPITAFRFLQSHYIFLTIQEANIRIISNLHVVYRYVKVLLQIICILANRRHTIKKILLYNCIKYTRN